MDQCYFVDLPGYGYAKVANADRERWDNLINGYFDAPRQQALLVQLIDCRHAPALTISRCWNTCGIIASPL